MAHTYTSNLVHVVFSTKERRDFIGEPIREKLWAYTYGIAKNHHIPLIAIGGTANHVHLLIALPATMSLSDAVTKLKANSSRWMRQTIGLFAWQEGYGAFSVSPSQTSIVKRYIRSQAEHHRKRDFAQEFTLLLKKSGISYDPTYVLG